MSWRKVISEYLMACHQDAQWTRESDWQRTLVIRRHGTEALQQREKRIHQRHLEQAAAMVVPTPDSFELVSKEADRIVADVRGVTFIEGWGDVTRFLLLKIDDHWRLEEIYWKCYCLPEGTCVLCIDATGRCLNCNGLGRRRGFLGWFKFECSVCGGKGQCKDCRGTGRCDHCHDSNMPGWVCRSCEFFFRKFDPDQ